MVGRRHAAVIAKVQGVELAAVVDPSDAGQAFALEHGYRCFASLTEMFAQLQPDGVILATPTPLHVAQGLECVEHQCAVLVEKPVATNAREAEALVARAAQAKVPLLVGHHRRHNALIQRAHQLILAGEIGEIRAVHATCWFYKPDSYFDVAPWRKKKGAGPISVNMVHDIDLIRYLCGEITSVHAQSAPSSRGFENEELAAALLTFENGAVGTISVADSIASPWSWELTARENPVYPATTESSYLIGGSRGSLSVPNLKLWQHKGQPDWWQPMCSSSVTCDNSDPLENQIRHFVAVIEREQEPLVSGLEGLRSLRVVEAIQQSSQSHQTVHLKPIEPNLENFLNAQSPHLAKEG